MCKEIRNTIFDGRHYDGSSLPDDITRHPVFTEAHITIIPKQGKDPAHCEKYRPISLLNLDLKLYAKILAERLKMFLPSLVHTDQAGFIPRREARDNTRKLINLVHSVALSKTPTVLLTTDAEEAFDRGDWRFLAQTLEAFGLSQRFRHHILSIYFNPSARVKSVDQESVKMKLQFLFLLLCLIVYIGFSLGNRVYIHPFNLFSYNKSECEKYERQNNTVGNLFIPNSIELKIKPEDEIFVSKISLVKKKPEDLERQRVSFLSALMNIVGFRAFNGWRKTHKGDTVLISYTDLFGSLVSFYLGASTNTSAALQAFLGFDHQSGDKNCASKVNGLKVISTLKIIDNLLFSIDKNIDSLKMICIFVSTNVPLSENFINNMMPLVDEFYVRAVDFTDSPKAFDLINEFLNARTSKKPKDVLTPIDPSTNLLFTSYIHFKAKLKNSFLMPELQDFWIEPNRKISVPMMSVTGRFQYKHDNSINQLILRIPFGENDFMLLVQPINGNTLENIESLLSWDYFLKLLDNLSSRHINLMLPKMEIESSYDIQDILNNLELTTLLGKKADLSKISNMDITVGKIINKVHFELEDSGINTDEGKALALEKDGLEQLQVSFDRPFLLSIFEGTTKALLFFGSVKHPVNVCGL
ncbi:angiotensinogen [Rhinophrynus dorsalis]